MSVFTKTSANFMNSIITNFTMAPATITYFTIAKTVAIPNF